MGLPLAKTNKQPVVVVQAVLSGDEVAIGTSLLAFSQYLGGAIFISAANTLFNNDLVTSLHKFAPEVNAHDVIEAGAASNRKNIPAADLPSILWAYNHAITQTFVRYRKA